MLGWRLAISAVLIPTVFGLFWCDHRLGQPAWLLLAVVLALAVRACWEMADLLRVRNLSASFPLTALLASGIVVAAWLPWTLQIPVDGSKTPWIAVGVTGFATAISLLLLFLATIVRYESPGRSMELLAAEWLTVCYVGGLLALTAQLRWVAGAEAGYLVLGSLLVGVKGGDIGAYTLGRLFGKRKMAPKLSPGKTWAGAVGAVLFSSLGTWAFLHVATPLFNAGWDRPAVVWCLLYGAVLGMVGLIGDLSESLIKRDVGKKDAAALMPGFGGLLDLIDSILYAGPVAWLLWMTLPLATWR